MGDFEANWGGEVGEAGRGRGAGNEEIYRQAVDVAANGPTYELKNRVGGPK